MSTTNKSRIIPREGGIAGVWIASLFYGLLYSYNKIPLEKLLLLLGSSAMILLLTPIAWREKLHKRLLLLMIGGAPYAVLSITSGKTGILYLGVSAALGVLVIVLSELDLIIIGGTLISMHGGLYLLKTNSDNLLLMLLPAVYSFMTISHAAYRISKTNNRAVAYYCLSSVLLLVYSVLLFNQERTVFFILIGDLLLRILLFLSGVFHKLSLKAYGFHETFHSLLILSIISLIIK